MVVLVEEEVDQELVEVVHLVLEVVHLVLEVVNLVLEVVLQQEEVVLLVVLHLVLEEQRGVGQLHHLHWLHRHLEQQIVGIRYLLRICLL